MESKGMQQSLNIFAAELPLIHRMLKNFVASYGFERKTIFLKGSKQS